MPLMQPACSPLQLGPRGPSPPPGSQGGGGGGGGGGACLQQLEEKLLFEKFWKGTFKAVATPRPESVIVASITARRRVPDSETTTTTTTAATATTATAFQQIKTDERKAADARSDTADRNGCVKGHGRKRHSHRRARSPSFDEEPSPRPKAKKKKRKSERKRKRKRSPSYSLSPLRKRKKKKKKKSSKRSKRHRYTSKKSKHSSSSLKHKRKDVRKHKKSSRTHSRRRRRYRRSESDSSSCQSSTEDRHHLQKSVVHQASGNPAAVREETNHTADVKWRRATKSVCKSAPKYRSILSAGTGLSSKPGSEVLHGNGPQHLPGRAKGPHDYDSGNDTSSPPSSKTGVSRASVADDKRNPCQRLASPEKLRFTDRDNASDSGNSVTSYASLCKPYAEDGLPAAAFSGKREQITLGCRVEVARSPKTSSCSQRRGDSPRGRLKSRASSSRSRSRSSGSSRYSGRYSRSPSLSSCSSYTDSLSNSADLRRRGSLSSRGSYSRYSADRLRGRKRTASSRDTAAKHKHRVNGKRRRRKSYSPMKKRRRDSPSHLEARRITSARKRPIPYFRPSPSSSSRSTSVSSWSSLFTRSRSRSPIHSVSRSRSRSHSYSSYRSYSRSSSWNSIFGTRSRSRSHSLSKKRKKSRRSRN